MRAHSRESDHTRFGCSGVPLGNTRMTKIKVKPLHLSLSENVKREGGEEGRCGYRSVSTQQSDPWRGGNKRHALAFSVTNNL